MHNNRNEFYQGRNFIRTKKNSLRSRHFISRQTIIWYRYFKDENMVSRAQFKKKFFIKYKKIFYSKAKGRSGPILVRYLYNCNENSSIFLQKLPEFWYFWHLSSRAQFINSPSFNCAHHSRLNFGKQRGKKNL